MRKQVEIGLDIVNDGEYGKTTELVTLCAPAHERFRAAIPARARRHASGGRRPEHCCELQNSMRTTVSASRFYRNDRMGVDRLIVTPVTPLFSATSPVSKAARRWQKQRLSMAAVAPASVAPDRIDEYYNSDEEYVFARR